MTTGLVAFTSGITLYLIISDTARRSVIRRRKNFLLTESSVDGNERGLTVLEKAQHRFGVLRIGGRFVNPFEEFVPAQFQELIIGGENKEHGNGRCGKS
jgi:hypothetical protein